MPLASQGGDSLQEAVTLCKLEKESATHRLRQPAQGQEQETHSDTDARKPHTKKLLSKSGRQIPEGKLQRAVLFLASEQVSCGTSLPSATARRAEDKAAPLLSTALPATTAMLAAQWSQPEGALALR